MREDNILNVEGLKRRATKLKKMMGITHSKALNIVARDHGYEQWADLVSAHNKFVSEEKRVSDRIPTRTDAHLSSFDRPDYIKAIFRP